MNKFLAAKAPAKLCTITLQIFLFYCCGLLLSGCLQVGPDYQKQKMELPRQWSHTDQSTGEQKTKSDEELTRWWTVFGDAKLTALIERTLANNFDIRIATARIRQTRAETGRAGSALGPVLNSSGSYQHQQTAAGVTNTTTDPTTGQSVPSAPVPGSSQTGTVISDQYRVGFDASWELDIFGGVRRTIEAADAELMSAIEAKRNVHISLAAEVAKTYIELRSLQLRIDIAKKNLKAQQRSADLTRKKFNTGFVNGLDVAYADSQTALTRAKIPLLKSAAQQKIFSLSVLAGLEPTALASELTPIQTIPAATLSHIVPTGVPSDLLRRRPDIRRAEEKIHAATAGIGVAEAELFPRFFITGATAYQSDSVNSLFDPVSWIWSFGPAFSWNLFQSGQTRANIEKQQAITEQAVIEYQQTVIKALQEVESVLVATAMEKEHFQALSDAVDANRKAVNLATTLYREGEIDFIQVLIAQGSLFKAEDAWAQSKSKLSENLVALYKAVGGGWNPEEAREIPEQ